MKKKDPYHIKNWKTAEEYPSPTKMKGPELAWEFLRRNGDYQKSVDSLLKKPILANQESFRTQWGFFVHIPLFKIRKIRGKLKRVFHYDPNADSPPRLKLAFKRHPRIVKAPIGANIVSPNIEQGDIIAVFNLKTPINRQIQDAKKALEAEQRRLKETPPIKASNRNTLLKYWRLLDGRAAGIPVKDLDDFFNLEHETMEASDRAAETAKDCLKAARKILRNPLKILSSLFS